MNSINEAKAYKFHHTDESSLNVSQEADNDELKESYLIEFDGDNKGE